MTEKYTLNVKKRDLKLKGKTYQQDGYILGNVFGLGESQAIALPVKETRKLFSEVGESSVIYLSLDDRAKETPVLLQEIQTDPITGNYIHIALKRINLNEKVRAAVAFEIAGELSVPDAVYILTKQEVEVEALPTDLPESFVVDLSKFTQIGDQLTFADLPYDRSKVQLLIDDETEPVLVIS